MLRVFAPENTKNGPISLIEKAVFFTVFYAYLTDAFGISGRFFRFTSSIHVSKTVKSSLLRLYSHYTPPFASDFSPRGRVL